MTLQSRSGPAATRPLLSLLALAVAVAALAGCGGGSSSSSTPAGGSSTPAPVAGALTLASNTEGQLTYDKRSLTAKAGTVSISFTNMAALEHNLTVASANGTTLGATPTFRGTTKTLTLKLTPGVYKYFCTVPGHRAAGMEGTLTVH